MINVDISNVWGQLSLPDLLAVEAEVASAHQALMEGTGAGGSLRGWLNLPKEVADPEISRILDAAERIRESRDALVVLGSGTACQGARGVIEVLQGVNRNLRPGEIQIYFAGNSLSTGSWNELLKLLEGKRFSICAVCSSGDGLEPAVWLRNLRWILERRCGTEEARKRIFAVADGEETILKSMAGEEGWELFVIPENQPAQFGLLSAAGLLPMAAAGVDIRAVLRGAREAKDAYNLRSFENPVWLYAAVRNLMHQGGRTVELLESREPEFREMGRWWQQLFAASGGKEGKGLFPALGVDAGDLYALGQFAREGRACLFETMLRFDSAGQSMVIGEDVKNLDGLNYLSGTTMDALSCRIYSHCAQTHGDGGIPVITVDCGDLTPEKLGEIIWFFQLSCAVSGYVMGLNPFDRSALTQYQEDLQQMLGKPGCENG